MSYVVGCCNVVAVLSMADMVCLDCMQKLCSVWAMLGLCVMLKFKLCCKILLLLNMADMGRLLCVWWAKLSTFFIQCRWNRLSAWREFCGVHSWQNGTKCRDGVKVLWCHSHLVRLVFEASIPTCTCFHEGKLFLTCFLSLFFSFLYCRLGMVREKKGGRGGQGRDAWSTFLFT